MAKSARASSKKSSKAKLRATVHGPQQDARLQRLSDKLVALATADQSNVPTSTMEVDEGTKRSAFRSKGIEKKHHRLKRQIKTKANDLCADASKPSTEEHNPEQGKEESVGTTCRSTRPTFDEEMFYNALGLFPISSIQGFDEFKCLSLAVS
ncbi:hypothetical protein BDZ91DRAFT_780752 [Kalaharituber pfeilii]|nr:hypothetical protein BDZ91DRAFT_780752 [Kalaharituber pfeilii]